MNKKNLKILVFLILLILLFLAIRSTYSKYATGIEDQTTSAHISNWNIKLNNTNIRNKANFTGDIVITKIPNAHISSNVIAPTSQGYFEVVLESTGTELAYDYEFDFVEDGVDRDLPDYIITKYQINSGSIIDIPLGDTSITGLVEPEASNVEVKLNFKFFVEWYDETDNHLDNYNDVLISKTLTTATIPLTLKISQHLTTPLGNVTP